jgi:formyltetrahydrofolate synthetase
LNLITVLIKKEIEFAQEANNGPIAGTIMRMPGFPNNPSAKNIDIYKNSVITGLFR